MGSRCRCVNSHWLMLGGTASRQSEKTCHGVITKATKITEITKTFANFVIFVPFVMNSSLP